MNAARSDEMKAFQRLREAQSQALHELDEKIRQCNKFREDYVKLQKRLETLPHELKYEITVPISKNAFMPGKLVNTNEILVLLGENWFVERSAKQACDMISRRLAGVDETLRELEKKVETIKHGSEWTDNLLKENSSYVNIEEKLDEPSGNVAKPAKAGSKRRPTDDEIKELRRKQQERAMRAVTDINKYIKQDLETLHSHEDEEEEEEEEGEEVKADADFTAKLSKEIEELNIEDSTATSANREKELTDLMAEYSKTVDRANNEMMSKILNAQAPAASAVSKETKKKAVHFQSDELQELSNKLDRHHQDDDDSEDEYSYEDEDDLEGIDQEEDSDDQDDNEPEPPKEAAANTCVIKVKHSAVEPASGVKVLSNSSVPRIESPADIYKVFYQPKSILKVKENQEGAAAESTVSMRIAQSAATATANVDELKSDKNKENEDSFKFEPQKAFPGEIVEKNVNAKTSSDSSRDSVPDAADKPSRPVSKFRANKTTR